MPTYILFRYLDCVHFVNYLHVVRLLSAVVGGRPRHIHGLRGQKLGIKWNAIRHLPQPMWC